ncbi:unnamed protein product [Lota lota]
MGKGTTKNTSNRGLVQPRQRSLRSRKRTFPEEKIALSSNNQTKHNPQDTETNSSTSAALPPCLPQPAQQDTTKRSTQPAQTEEQATDSVIAPTSFLAASACAEPVMDRAMKETDCEKSVLTSCIAAGVLDNLKITQLSKHNPDKKEAMEVKEHSRSSSITPMDQRGFVIEAGEDDDAEGCASLCQRGQMEEENGGNKHQSNKCSRQKSDPVCTADDREPVVVRLSKRRKRMGMCVLTEKERSHFLQKQKHEKEKLQRKTEDKRVEDRGCTKDRNMELNEDKPCSCDESNLVAEEGNLAFVLNSPVPQLIKVGPLTKQSELEKEPLPPICEAVDSSETEAHTFVTACEECSDAWNPIDQAPVRSELKTDDLTSPSKNCGQGPISDIDVSFPTEIAGSKDEPEKRENLMEDVDKPHHFPTPGSATSALQNVLIESENDHREEDQTSQQLMDSLARTVGLSEMVEMERCRHGSQPSHSFTDAGLGRSENIGTQPGTDAAAPSGADENSGFFDDVGTISSPVATQHLLARETPDLLGFGSFDYISDSQLHNINLIEAQGGQMAYGGSCSSHCLEDATDLVHGLIRELSSLNRIVMATQRKVENLRRCNRGPKAY